MTASSKSPRAGSPFRENAMAPQCPLRCQRIGHADRVLRARNQGWGVPEHPAPILRSASGRSVRPRTPNFPSSRCTSPVVYNGPRHNRGSGRFSVTGSPRHLVPTGLGKKTQSARHCPKTAVRAALSFQMCFGPRRSTIQIMIGFRAVATRKLACSGLTLSQRSIDINALKPG
jgi:hypothetical protein